MGNILSIRDLEIQRGGNTVLRVADISVQQGEVLAIIGPNGAGKSTLLLAVSRLLPIHSGEILFYGKSLNTYDDLTYRRRIALVLQDPLLLDASVYDNVAVGLRFRGSARHEVKRQTDEWISRLGITHLRERSVRQLSGGEAQRVSLARAFALQPELLLLDEPFSALDAPTRAALLEDFHTLLAQTALTTLFVTHDLDEALLLGNRVAVLLGGSLRQAGIPPEVFSAPADREVAAFVGIETVISGAVVSSDNGALTIAAGDFHLQAIGESAIGRDVLLCLRPEDITLWPVHLGALKEGSPSSSARNRLRGTIQRMLPQGPLVRVVVNCGFPVVALVTRLSVQELNLEVGQEVCAAFKASAVHLIPR